VSHRGPRLIRSVELLGDNALKAELADGFEYFAAIAFCVFDVLNAAATYRLAPVLTTA